MVSTSNSYPTLIHLPKSVPQISEKVNFATMPLVGNHPGYPPACLRQHLRHKRHVEHDGNRASRRTHRLHITSRGNKSHEISPAKVPPQSLKDICIYYLHVCIHLTDCSWCLMMIISITSDFFDVFICFPPFQPTETRCLLPPEANVVAMFDRMMWTLRATMPITIKCPTMEENITWAMQKTLLLSMKSWLVNKDPFLVVYENNPHITG